MNKRQKRGMFLLVLGLLLVLAALGIHIAQEMEDRRAGQTAAMLLEQLDNKSLPIIGTQSGNREESADPAMPEKKYMNYTLIGSISVPSVGIRLPVLDGWSEEMLKVAPCRYMGSISGGNMIIMGHNYKSHFTPLQSVSVGAVVTFENVLGISYQYRVAKIEKLHRDDGEKLASDYPLTIFTCTPGGIERFVVRCEPVK